LLGWFSPLRGPAGWLAFSPGRPRGRQALGLVSPRRAGGRHENNPQGHAVNLGLTTTWPARPPSEGPPPPRTAARLLKRSLPRPAGPPLSGVRSFKATWQSLARPVRPPCVAWPGETALPLTGRFLPRPRARNPCWAKLETGRCHLPNMIFLPPALLRTGRFALATHCGSVERSQAGSRGGTAKIFSRPSPYPLDGHFSSASIPVVFLLPGEVVPAVGALRPREPDVGPFTSNLGRLWRPP